MNETKELILSFQKNRDYSYFTKLAISRSNCIDELINLCYSNEFPFPNYSSWLLAQITDRYTEKTLPFHTKLIDCVLTSNNETVQRNILHALLVFPLSNYKDGEMLDFLFRQLNSTSTKVGIRVYSMYMISNFCKIYPELKNELLQSLSIENSHYTPAYHAAKRKVLNILKQV